MTVERDNQIINARLDEHGRLITQQGERQNIQAVRIDGLTLVMYGDDEKRVKGLLERTSDLERQTSDILQWRREIMIYLRVGIFILTVTSLGTWLPYIRELLILMGV